MKQHESGASGADQFSILADLFFELGVFSSPSELHGLLCGKLVSEPAFSESQWLASAGAYLEQAQLESETARQTLAEIYGSSQTQLAASGFELELVLPADEEEIAVRSESIGRWCVGFLAGFAPGRTSDLSADARESLGDLAEIARIEEPPSEGEEYEQDFMEIAEYVRMVAIMLFSELHTDMSDLQSANEVPSIH